MKRAKSCRRSVHIVSLAASQIKVRNGSPCYRQSPTSRSISIRQRGKLKAKRQKKLSNQKVQCQVRCPVTGCWRQEQRPLWGEEVRKTSEAALIRLVDNHIAKGKVEENQRNIVKKPPKCTTPSPLSIVVGSNVPHGVL